MLNVHLQKPIAHNLGSNLQIAELITLKLGLGDKPDLSNFLSHLKLTLCPYPVGKNELILFKYRVVTDE